MSVFKRRVIVVLTLFFAGCGAGSGGRMPLPAPPVVDSGTPVSADATGEATIQSTDLSASSLSKFPRTSTIIVRVNQKFHDTLRIFKAPFSSTSAQAGLCCDFSKYVFDAKGDLLAMGVLGTVMDEYAPPYTGEPTVTSLLGITNSESVYEMAVSPAGELFVHVCTTCTGRSATYGDEVLVYASPYSSAPLKTIVTGISKSRWLGFDGVGDLFVENGSNGSISEYASPYTGAPKKTVSVVGGAYPTAKVDASGDIFVFVGNTVTEYRPPYTGSSTKRAFTLVGLNNPTGFAVDANDYIFAVNTGNNTVTEYAPPRYTTYNIVGTYSGTPTDGIYPALYGPIIVH